MNFWVVSSQVTFIPNNYVGILEELVTLPEVRGLILLQNRNPNLLGKGFVFWLSRLAPAIGWNLLRNYFSSFRDPRIALFLRRGKKAIRLATMNCPEALALVKSEKIDLLINARTRDIYRGEILKAPTHGCINIHHGLLPDQRGVFCDLWALQGEQDAGFTIHKMTPKLDDGEILHVERVAKADEKLSFADYMHRGPILEGRCLKTLLGQFLRDKKLSGTANARTPRTKYFKNPRLQDLRDFKKRGFRV